MSIGLCLVLVAEQVGVAMFVVDVWTERLACASEDRVLFAELDSNPVQFRVSPVSIPS